MKLSIHEQKTFLVDSEESQQDLFCPKYACPIKFIVTYALSEETLTDYPTPIGTTQNLYRLVVEE